MVYQQIPDAQEILKCGKLKGLISKCPYLSVSGGSHDGTYILKLDRDMFANVSFGKTKIPFKKGWTCEDFGLLRFSC